MKHKPLGEQALHLIRDTADRTKALDRAALRARIEEASVRPAPGQSDLLGRPLGVRTDAGIDHAGNVRAVDTHDLIGMAPVHLAGHPLKLKTGRRDRAQR